MQEQQVETGKLYKQELTRVHKKSIPATGKIWLVVSCRQVNKNGPMVYSKAFQVLIGTPDERIDEMAHSLYLQIKKQFSL